MSAHREGCDSVFGCACDPSAPRDPAAGATPAREGFRLPDEGASALDALSQQVEAAITRVEMPREPDEPEPQPDQPTYYALWLADAHLYSLRALLAALRERDAAREDAARLREAYEAGALWGIWRAFGEKKGVPFAEVTAGAELYASKRESAARATTAEGRSP